MPLDPERSGEDGNKRLWLCWASSQEELLALDLLSPFLPQAQQKGERAHSLWRGQEQVPLGPD